MPGSITPLPIFAELDAEDRATYEKLEPPKTIVVRYGYMKEIAELPYDGEAKPGCGSKMIIRSPRGTEMAEMLTTTCANSGCGKSVSRKQMLEYIDNSGGRDYPFTTQGRILRVATVEDLNSQSAMEGKKIAMIKFTKAIVAELDLAMKLVDIEMLLGGERIIFHYVSEQWIDFRELVRRLAAEYRTRIEMHQVNARDEARLVADYEKCGQHCCCKQFLKVLKPVSMRSAKVQKATLDPTKISGRCGRLMCCLRYEDETYESLRKKLPKKNTRVRTDDGPGTVVDSQILTQLVLVALDTTPGLSAFPLENIELLPRDQDTRVVPPPQSGRDGPASRGEDRRPGAGPGSAPRGPGPTNDRQEPRRPAPGAPLRQEEVESREGTTPIVPPANAEPQEEADDDGEEQTGDGGGSTATGETVGNASGPTGGNPPALGPDGKPRRRRRRRRGRGRGQGGGPSPAPGPGGPPPAGPSA